MPPSSSTKTWMDIAPPVSPAPKIAVAAPQPKIVSATQLKIVEPQPFSQPAAPKQQQSNVLHRQTVRKPVEFRLPDQTLPPKKRPAVRLKKPSLIKLPKPAYSLLLIFIVTAVLVGSGIFLSARSDKTKVLGSTDVAVEDSSSYSDPSKLSELKPTANSMSAYRVSPDVPRIITIPKLYVYSKVIPVSLNNNNEVLAPNNIYEAGWYNGSVKPQVETSAGTTVVVGHMIGPTREGIFARANTLAQGDIIRITLGNGQNINYSVTDISNFDSTAALTVPIAPAAAPNGKQALKLIACDNGGLPPGSGCLQRSVIVAVQS